METILVIGILIAAAVLLWPSRAQRLAEQYAAALEVLDERYDRGEITREEYLQKKGDILEYPLAP